MIKASGQIRWKFFVLAKKISKEAQDFSDCYRRVTP